MRVLNLYAGIGGNRHLWPSSWIITAVEINPKVCKEYKRRYPGDTVVCADAHQYLLENYQDFDLIWTSPPCPTHSKTALWTRHKKRYPDMALYQEIIFLSHVFKGKWVVENVKPYYTPLIEPTAVVSRHYFWSNLESIEEGWSHPTFKASDGKFAIQAHEGDDGMARTSTT
jgi:DNA (cytosine-5)-methyltransferase 1